MKNFFGEAVDWLGGALEDVGEVIGDVSTFVAGLPNELVGLADRLSEGQREAAAGAVQEQREFAINRALGEFGPYILFGGLALAVFALAKR